MREPCVMRISRAVCVWSRLASVRDRDACVPCSRGSLCPVCLQYGVRDQARMHHGAYSYIIDEGRPWAPARASGLPLERGGSRKEREQRAVLFRGVPVSVPAGALL